MEGREEEIHVGDGGLGLCVKSSSSYEQILWDEIVSVALAFNGREVHKVGCDRRQSKLSPASERRSSRSTRPLFSLLNTLT